MRSDAEGIETEASLGGSVSFQCPATILLYNLLTSAFSCRRSKRLMSKS